MIVCLCHGLTEDEIRKSIRAGHWTCESIGQNCGAGTECGSCCQEICKMVSEEKRKRVLDAVDGLTNGVGASLDEIRKAVGDLTVNDILDLVSEAIGEDKAPDAKPTDDEGEGELQ